MKFYKALIYKKLDEWLFVSPLAFDLEYNSKEFSVLKDAGCIETNKVFKLTQYDENNDFTDFGYFCSDYETLINFWEGFRVGWTISKQIRKIEFSRN